jgi:hypothetical protein
MLKYLGLAAVLISWIAVGFLLYRWRNSPSLSVSKHAAAARGAYWVLAVALLAGGWAFYYWTMAWLVPLLDLGNGFIALATLAIVGQSVAAIVPDKPGWQSRVHLVAAYGMALLYFPISLNLLGSPYLPEVARVVGVVYVAYALAAWILFIAVSWARRYYLVFQTLYVIMFQLFLLAAGYL